MKTRTSATTAIIADAIRDACARAERNYERGLQSAAIDLHDVVEMLTDIAARLDPENDAK